MDKELKKEFVDHVYYLMKLSEEIEKKNKDNDIIHIHAKYFL